MFSARQIRAARALAGWDAGELAKRTSLSRDTISNIENGKTQPYLDSVDRISKALGESGVEFIENEGVRIKPHGVNVLVGQHGLHEFFDQVYQYSAMHGGTIVQFGVDEKQFLTHLGKDYSVAHVKRMIATSQQRKDLKVKAIICEGETNYLAPEYNEYRWISKDIFQAVPFYIYGETLAIMDFNTVPSPTIIIHNFPAITQAYRKQFEAFWQISRSMPKVRI